MNPGIIFPAFVNEYSGQEQSVLSLYNNNFRNYLLQASDFLHLNLSSFDFAGNNFLNDELKSQYITYIFSCSVADILKEQKITPSFVSGYSMGIYASLYYCDSVSFIDGLGLIKSAWESILSVTSNNKYGMGMIVGLSEEDIQQLLNDVCNVYICNQNNAHTIIISGVLNSVENILGSAKNEGALRANLLPVSKPYHSLLLNKAIPTFKNSVDSIPFSEPVYNYISAMDLNIIKSSVEFKKEVVENINGKMNWYKTMNLIISLNTHVIFECGAGNGLTRNSKFISGDYNIFHIGKLDEFLKTCNM